MLGRKKNREYNNLRKQEREREEGQIIKAPSCL